MTTLTRWLLVLILFAGSSTTDARRPAAVGAAIGPTTAIVPTGACDALKAIDLTAVGGAGSSVATAAEGTGAQPGTMCVVEGVIAPAIRFRVELPLHGWTERYLQTGCGGLCGNLRINVGAADGCPIAAAGGFVLASTDMGHEGMDSAWTKDPRKRADFAYRGVHLTAVAAKALIRAFYGRDTRYAYFSGCSDGGREALVEAQRFPDDFDGIVAGAPAMAFTVQNSLFHGWQARANTDAGGKPILLAGRLPILHAAVLAACDADDGLADGIVATPSTCRFDPVSIVCRAGGATDTCLTRDEAAVARRFYEGPRDAKTGVRLTQGGPQYGSELQWAGVYVPQAANQPIFSNMVVAGAMGPLISPDGAPATAADLTFDRATFEKLSARHAFYDATSPDLTGFQRHGGKLILYHGWADPHISPLNTIAYHDAVRRQMGARVADGFERLYLLPGMGHCSGGEGPSALDLLTPIIDWVERGRAPDVIATRTAAQTRSGLPVGDRRGGATGSDARANAGPPAGMMPTVLAGPKRTRPIYPYPHVAAYSGKGDPNDAVNWRRGGAVPVAIPMWAGSWYFRPYAGEGRLD